jgi:hypothetical protein
MPKPAIYIPGFPGTELFDAATKQKLFPPAIGDLLDAAKKEALLNKLSVISGVEAGEPILGTLGVFKPAA